MSDIASNQTERLEQVLTILDDAEDLDREQSRTAMREMLEGRATPQQIERLLTRLHEKGETVEELTGFAEAMRAAAEPLFSDSHPRPDGTIVDTCGTGGDGRGTFNISTTAALVVAACGVPVAKHGNRSITSRCGSADVMEALGVEIAAPAARVADCVREVGIGFLFAPSFHASTRHVQPVRRKLDFRTVFNLLGPLTNPAGVDAQVVGVFAPEWLEPMAETLGRLGVRRAFVVHSRDGLDEVSLAGETLVAELYDRNVRQRTLKAEDFGLSESSVSSLQGGDARANADIIRAVLAGKEGPAADVTVANAALALVAAGAAEDLKDGVARARDALQSGAATRLLERFAEFSHGHS